MANRPKRNKRKSTSQPNNYAEDPGMGLDPAENLDSENKTYRNKPKKRKPFVPTMSLKNYKPKTDKYFN
jgi:hypothetical protein